MSSSTDTNLIEFKDTIHNILIDREEEERDSHRKIDADTFHASQLPFCERQLLLRKFGLTSSRDYMGKVRIGTIVHNWLTEEFKERHPQLEYEKRVTREFGDITLTGEADIYDPTNEVVYDMKTRGGWYNFDGIEDRHRAQVQLYMQLLGANDARIIYISKKDLDSIKERPKSGDGAIEFSPDEFMDLIEKAERVREAILEYGVPTAPEEIPFNKCGCYFCESERLSLPSESDPIANKTFSG